MLAQNVLAGKPALDDFAFEADEHGYLELTDDGKEVINEAFYLTTSDEAPGLPGYSGNR